MQQANTLNAYDSKSDCFKNAARALRQDCKNIDIDENEKTQCRVPQLWTSYSGYFREVKTMCLAVQYSLEHDKLRKLQRDLGDTHKQQIELLKEQQRVLAENNLLATKHLSELEDLHSIIATKVYSILNSTGALKDELRSVLEQATKLVHSVEKEAHRQDIAISKAQESNIQLLSIYQDSVYSVNTISEVVGYYKSSQQS
ncbi:hypothetical protein FBU30_005745 [Linnemannia zychae]|nr:hypothetical protein FBU30_005745 [Linnemannia zychae]